MILKDTEEIIGIFKSLNYEVKYEDEHRYNLNIVGFRNKLSRADYFDDTIGVFYQEAGKWIVHFFEGTTLPGKPHLLKPVNAKGAAILAPGQYKDAYKLGLHKCKYEALVQRESVKVFRDTNKDLRYDQIEQTSEVGFFGINIHRASFGAKLVGPNSAGCQVVKNVNDYDTLMSLCRKASSFCNNKFTYTLVEI